MNERGHYGGNGNGHRSPFFIGATPPGTPHSSPSPPPPPSKPWWGSALGVGLSVGFLGLLGYGLYDMVKSGRDWDKEFAREDRLKAAWSPAKREQWADSGLTVDAFEDWLKTGRGMTVREWLRATPEKA